MYFCDFIAGGRQVAVHLVSVFTASALLLLVGSILTIATERLTTMDKANKKVCYSTLTIISFS